MSLFKKGDRVDNDLGREGEIVGQGNMAGTWRVRWDDPTGRQVITTWPEDRLALLPSETRDQPELPLEPDGPSTGLMEHVSTEMAAGMARSLEYLESNYGDGSSRVRGFVTKDSGERREWDTGSVRDVRVGKGRFDLLPVAAIRRLAQLLERGADKYGERNWELGQPLSSYVDSGLRHAFQVAEGAKDEDHAAAVLYNFAAFMFTAEKIAAGELPAVLDDMGFTNVA